MRTDIYDTYATAPNGSLMHFDFYVLAGTCLREVEQLACQFVGGDDPEIEAQFRCTQHVSEAPHVLADLKLCGYSAQPMGRSGRSAA